MQRDLKEIFTRLKQTAVLVTHDMGEAAYLANEIVLMNEGRIVQRGSAADLRDHPANEFVSEFINAQRSARFENPVLLIALPACHLRARLC